MCLCPSLVFTHANQNPKTRCVKSGGYFQLSNSAVLHEFALHFIYMQCKGTVGPCRKRLYITSPAKFLLIWVCKCQDFCLLELLLQEETLPAW